MQNAMIACAIGVSGVYPSAIARSILAILAALIHRHSWYKPPFYMT